MKSTHSIIFAVVVGFLALTLILTYSPAAEEAKPAKKEPVQIDGDHLRIQGKQGEQVATITGNVIIKYREMVLTADHAVYTEKTKIVVADGNLKIVDPDNEITGNTGTAYLNDRKSIIEGTVKLITKPKPSEGDKKNESVRSKYSEPVTVTCDRLEYLYRDKIATAEGNLKITQKDRVLTSNKAVYDVNNELVTLTGNVNATDEKKQTFTSNGTVRVSLKEGAEWMEADNASAVIQVDVDEKENGAAITPENNK